MFKKLYTPEEVAEAKAWFERYSSELPETLQLNAATHYLDLKKALGVFFSVYEAQGNNPTFGGQISQIFLIRQRLEEMGIGDMKG